MLMLAHRYPSRRRNPRKSLSECFAPLEPQQAELIKLRYFVGLKIEEAAEVLGISEATAKRWWGYARAWLFNEIQSNP